MAEGTTNLAQPTAADIDAICVAGNYTDAESTKFKGIMTGPSLVVLFYWEEMRKIFESQYTIDASEVQLGKKPIDGWVVTAMKNEIAKHRRIQAEQGRIMLSRGYG